MSQSNEKNEKYQKTITKRCVIKTIRNENEYILKESSENRFMCWHKYLNSFIVAGVEKGKIMLTVLKYSLMSILWFIT